MTDQLTAIFVFVDDVLQAMRGLHQLEDCRRQNSDAAVLTTALAAALFFGGNQERARVCLHANGMIPQMLGKSRFCRRLHALAGVLEAVFLRLGTTLKTLNPATRYVVDSFPVALCDNMRSKRCRLVQNESFRGKIASKRRFFYGVRVHVVATEAGLPVEFALLPGSASDQRGLDVLPLNLPAGSELYADAAFTCYWLEDALREQGDLDLQVCYRANSLRREHPALEGFKTLMRRPIESTFSAITRLFGHHVHAVSFAGFQIKLALFLLAFTLDKLVK